MGSPPDPPRGPLRIWHHQVGVAASAVTGAVVGFAVFHVLRGSVGGDATEVDGGLPNAMASAVVGCALFSVLHECCRRVLLRRLARSIAVTLPRELREHYESCFRAAVQRYVHLVNSTLPA